MVETHDHLCQVVANRADLIDSLAKFMGGLGPREGIFVHRYGEDEAWVLLKEAGPARELHDQGLLHIFSREDAFQGGSPRIHHDHVADTVAKALAGAQSRGRGLAILADASRAYIQEGRTQEWFAFENWLGRRLDSAVGLVCLYWQDDLHDPAHLDGMMKTHLARLETGDVWSTADPA